MTNVTQGEALTSLQMYNNTEIDLIQISRGYTPLLSTLIDLGRGLNGGQYSKIGLNEKVSTNFPKYVWKEKDEFNKTYVLGADAAAADTTLTLVSTKGLYEGLIFRIPSTGEQIRVDSITSDTVVAVTRWVGSTAADATSGDKVIMTSSASSKGQASLNSFYTEANEKFNYFQKFLTTVNADDFDNLAYYGNNLEGLMSEKKNQHVQEIENGILFNKKAVGTDANGKTFYTLDWVITHCENGYTADISGSLSKKVFEETIAEPFRYVKNGNTKKLGLGSSKAISAIKELYTDMIRVGSIKEVNMEFEKIKVNRGELVFVEHPELTSDSGYENQIFILDTSFLKVVYPSGKNMVSNAGVNGKTKFVINQAKTNFANIEGSYVTYLTLELGNANAFGAIKVVA